MEKKEELKTLVTIKYLCWAILVLVAICFFCLLIMMNNNTSASDTNKAKEPTETTNEGEYDVSMFEQIDANGLKKAFDSSEIQVVYLGRATCGYCVQFLPILQQAQSEYGYTTKYIDISAVSDKDAEKITAMDDFLAENYGTTPLVILVKDGKLIDGHIGYAEYETFAEFLNNNGIK